MSTWTHVAAVFRIDRIRPLQGDAEDIEALIGKEEPYYDYIEGEFYRPTGSEGPLNWDLWINPDRNHAAAYTLTVFGDLRDYDTDEPIIEWFKEVVKRSVFIRQAVCTINVEYPDRTTTITVTRENNEPMFNINTL